MILFRTVRCLNEFFLFIYSGNTFGYVDLFHNPLLYSKNEKMLDGEWYLRLSNTRSKRKTEEMPFFDLFQKICLRKRGLPDCIMDNFQPRFIAYNE